MNVTIELRIKTDDADKVDAGDVAVAIRDAIQVIDMPDGSRIYLDDLSVIVKEVS